MQLFVRREPKALAQYREELADKLTLPSCDSILLLPTMVGLESLCQ